MSDWDHRAAFAKLIGDASEGQQAEGGFNKDNNCVPTTETIICQAYGGPDINPQDITTRTYGASFHGGEDYGPTLTTLRTLWSDCPVVDFRSVQNALSIIDPEAEQRHAIACSFWCDGFGTIQPHQSGILHVSVVVAHLAGQVHVLNVERDAVVVLSEADFAAATSGNAGQLMIFQRPLPLEDNMGMTPQEKAAQDLVDALLVRDMYLGRTSSLTDVQFTANRMLASDPEAGTWEITGSAEATASGGLIGEVAALRAEVTAMRALLAQDQAADVATAGSAAQSAAVTQLQADMANIAKAAGGK